VVDVAGVVDVPGVVGVGVEVLSDDCPPEAAATTTLRPRRTIAKASATNPEGERRESADGGRLPVGEGEGGTSVHDTPPPPGATAGG
jgi:hypothetical protein